MTEDVLNRGMDMVRKTLSNPQSLEDFSSSFRLDGAFLHPNYGLAADYAEWKDYRVNYEDSVDQLFGLRRLEMKRLCAENPLSAPIMLERWARRVETASLPLDILSVAFEAADIPFSKSVQAQKNESPLEIFNEALLEAYQILDKDALGALSDRERALLPFLVRILCTTGGTYQPKAADAPRYSWGFPYFAPGDNKTPLGIDVPDELPSYTSIYHFWRSLTGEDIVLQPLAASRAVLTFD